MGKILLVALASFLSILTPLGGTRGEAAVLRDYEDLLARMNALGQSAQLVFTSAPQTIAQGTCSGSANVQLQTSNGQPFLFNGSVGVPVTAWANAVLFYSDSACSVAATMFTLDGTTASGHFYFKGTVTGQATISASLFDLSSAGQDETITAAAVNGACGSANGVPVSAPPTTNLCSSGTASTVTGSGPFTWSCSGSNGGSSASCSAALASNYQGFLDTYSSLGATWGFSSYKLANAYTGNWGTVKRQSDNTTANIGFASDGRADVQAFNAFCANTNCYLTTLVDQVNGINATQTTLAKMPRVIVDTNNVLAVCPQPGSKMSTAYNPLVNTPKVHLFTVARAAYADNRWSQSGVPTTTVTGNVTAGSNTITAMSSQIGISAVNGNYNPPTFPGITDSAGYIAPNQAYISALPSGSTATIAFSPGFLSPTGTMAGDTLVVTNSVLDGAWIVNGPASSTFYSSAYWGVGLGGGGGYAGDWTAPRNGTIGYNSLFQNVIGNGMRGQWAVYDYDTYTTQLNFNGVSLGNLTSTAANITYSTNTGMTLFSDPNGNESTSQSCFETMVLFPATEPSRVQMAQALMAQDNIAFPFASNTPDGFTMTGYYQPSFSNSPDNVFGAYAAGPDVFGQTWNMQGGGYTWPSIARATNISNSATLWRFIVQPGDSDVNITQAERAEINAGTTVAPGQHFSIFYQFQFEQLPNQIGDWCYSGQVHYNNALSGVAPDLVTFSCLNGQAQFQLQKSSGGNPVTTNCGSALNLVPGTTYAVEIEGFWSANHTSDTISVHAGVNGTNLAQVCSVGPAALWDNDTGAYLKAGVYRGYPWSNAGTIIERQMNTMFSTTQNAYASFITTQPALPVHN